ncbi:ATP-binding protein, partial [Trueperella pyogenes]
MAEPEFISFQTANTAATHLGRKLYTSSPSALAELVANSYDAYATKVWIKMERQGDSIIIADNGIGMSLDT